MKNTSSAYNEKIHKVIKFAAGLVSSQGITHQGVQKEGNSHRQHGNQQTVFQRIHACDGCGNYGAGCVSESASDILYKKSEYAAGDRTYSMDVLPQEYPVLGTGDYRSNHNFP